MLPYEVNLIFKLHVARRLPLIRRRAFSKHRSLYCNFVIVSDDDERDAAFFIKRLDEWSMLALFQSLDFPLVRPLR